MISGLGRMGWVDADAILAAAAFPAAEEAQLLADLTSELVPRARVLGIDRFGLDIEIERRRERQRFPDAPIDADQLAPAVRRMLRDR